MDTRKINIGASGAFYDNWCWTYPTLDNVLGEEFHRMKVFRPERIDGKVIIGDGRIVCSYELEVAERMPLLILRDDGKMVLTGFHDGEYDEKALAIRMAFLRQMVKESLASTAVNLMAVYVKGREKPLEWQPSSFPLESLKTLRKRIWNERGI